MTPKPPAQSGRRAKQVVRDLALANRNSHTPDSLNLCRHLEPFLSGLQGVVVIYDALEKEVDLSSLWSENETKLKYGITRTPTKGRDLTVHSITSEMEVHKWGYRQPIETAPQIADTDIDAVLVPGLAFDLAGGRLGWGAGYYDRFLARLGPNVLRVGISGGFIVERVPTEAHDVAMTHIATSSGVVACEPG